jgi:hypothetical protein
MSQRAIEEDHGMTVEIAGTFHASMPSDIGAAGVERPWRVGQLAADEDAVPAFTGPESDVGLALGEVEIVVRDQQIDAHRRIARVKHVEQPRNETVCHPFRAGQAHRAARRGVGRGDLAVEAGDRGFHGFGMWPQLFAEAGQPVADRQAFDQLAADGLFQCGEPALHRGLVDAQVLGRRNRRTGACDGEEIP